MDEDMDVYSVVSHRYRGWNKIREAEEWPLVLKPK
jgi:hypothetical protein